MSVLDVPSTVTAPETVCYAFLPESETDKERFKKPPFQSNITVRLLRKLDGFLVAVLSAQFHRFSSVPIPSFGAYEVSEIVCVQTKLECLLTFTPSL